jgi:uncharacterized protein YbaP (TraB family)
MKRLLSLVLAWLALAAPAWAAPPIWRITDGKAEITLFGSVHLLSRDVVWKSPALLDDLSHAKSLWFEVPFDAAGRQEAAAAAAAQGFLPPGTTLSSLLDAETRARLQRTAPGLGLSPAQMETFQPWLAEVALGVAFVQKQGAEESLGVEAQLQALAGSETARKALETPAQQIGFFADAPLPAQAASLAETLRQIEQEPDSFKALETAWTAGDLKALEAEALEPMKAASPEVFDRLVTRRNQAWAEAMAGMLKSGEQAFIVVGVGHLIGPGGVPELMRRRGFKVEGP